MLIKKRNTGMSKIATVIIILSFLGVYAADTTRTVVYSKDTSVAIKLPTNITPKAPTNWSKIKDLFL